MQKNIYSALANIASHHKDLAETVIEADVLQRAIIHLGHDSTPMKKQSIRLVQEISKQSMEVNDRWLNLFSILL